MDARPCPVGCADNVAMASETALPFAAYAEKGAPEKASKALAIKRVRETGLTRQLGSMYSKEDPQIRQTNLSNLIV